MTVDISLIEKRDELKRRLTANEFKTPVDVVTGLNKWWWRAEKNGDAILGTKKDLAVRSFFVRVRSSLVEFGNRLADRAFIEDLLVVSHADEEGGGTEAVHLPGDTLGVIIDASQSIIGEQTAALVA